MSKLSNFVIALIFSFVVSATPAVSQDVAEFYRGKTINMEVGGSAGGGYDALARAIARLIGNHLPGTPSVLVRNMPGAGGMIATNYTFSTAEKAGSALGLAENSTPLAPLSGTREARYAATTLNWLGTPSVEVGLVLLWHTVPVNNLDDLRTKPTTMGAPGVRSTQAFYTRLLN